MSATISSKEAARRLGVSPRRVQELIKTGQLKARKLSGVWLVDEESVVQRAATVNKRGGRPPRGSAKNETVFTLMNRTHAIADVVYDVSRMEFVHVGELRDVQRAPIGLGRGGARPSLAGFNSWWRSRGIPATRINIEQVLRESGVQVPEELIQRNLGLSLSDQYWICPDGSGLKWEDVNFFSNDFEAVDAATSPFAANSSASAHPTNTSDGNLEKRWLVRGDVRMLEKAGQHNNQEPFNELVATALHRRLLVPGDYVSYQLEGSGLSARSLCACFVTDEEEYVPAWYVQRVLPETSDRDDYRHYLACCAELGVEGAKESLDRMIVCDDILANHDRHYRNFGIVRNVETLECRPAPLFDSGSSLWCDVGFEELSRGERSFASKQFYENPGRQLLLVDDFSWFDASALEGFVGEAMGILGQNDAIEKRLPYIRSALEWRLERMVGIAEWS